MPNARSPDPSPSRPRRRAHTRTRAAIAELDGAARAPRTGGAAAARRRRAERLPVRPEDLRAIRLVSDPRLAPDGRAVVFVRKHAGEKNEWVTDLWIADVDGGEPRPFTSGGRDSHPRWSPDGSRLAFIGERTRHAPQIHVIDARGGEARALTAFPEGTIREFAWSPDGGQIAVAFRPTAPEWTSDARKQREETGLSTPPRVIDDWFYRFDGDGYFVAQRFALHLVDATSGAGRVVFDSSPLGEFGFDFSPDGRQIAIVTNLDPEALVRPWKASVYRLDLRTRRLTEVPGLPPGAKEAPAWSPDGKLIAYAGAIGERSSWGTENTRVFVCDPRHGRARDLLGVEDLCLHSPVLSDTAEARFDARLTWSPDARRVFFEVGREGALHVASVPRGGGPITFHTGGRQVASLGSLSARGDVLALTVTSPERPADVYLARLDARGARAARGAGRGRTSRAAGGTVTDAAPLRRLTDFNRDWLAQHAIARPRPHRVRTADGTSVHVWVMLPPDHDGRGRRRLPAVLEVHGGPHAQYGDAFFHEFQVLAAQGYAVFYSNPRGSKGYGQAHCEAIRGDWGRHDWTDVQAVVEFMRGQPFVDPARTGIMGGSYGGYMTNWAIGHTDVFAGAITDRCVSNLVSMVGSSDILEAPDGYWPGNAWDRPEALWDQSPLKYIGRARTPTLVIHSEGDLRCNVEQAEQVFAALKHLGVPTRFVRYPSSTSHGMSRAGPADLRIHRLEQILAWWQRWLKDKRV